MNTQSNPTTGHTFREDDILQAAAQELGIDFPSIRDYTEMSTAEKYIAHLATQIRGSEDRVETAVKHVQDNAANALTRPSSLGVIQGSGPMLDVYVATLTEQHSNLVTAMRMLLAETVPSAAKALDAAEMAWADSKFYGHS